MRVYYLSFEMLEKGMKPFGKKMYSVYLINKITEEYKQKHLETECSILKYISDNFEKIDEELTKTNIFPYNKEDWDILTNLFNSWIDTIKIWGISHNELSNKFIEYLKEEKVDETIIEKFKPFIISILISN